MTCRTPNEVDIRTNHGTSTARLRRNATFLNGITTVDNIKREDSFNRYESNSKEFERKYDRQSGGQDGSVTNIDGKESGRNSLNGYYKDYSEISEDFIAYTVVDTKIWSYNGTQTHLLVDKGTTISDIQSAKMEYDSKNELAGPFLFSGNILSESNVNPAILVIAGGLGGLFAPYTNKVNMESYSKWAGTVSSDKTNSGPHQFTTTLKKKTVYDDNANSVTVTLKVTDLIGVNGRPTSGTINKKSVKLGKDTIDQTTIGTLSNYTSAENDQPAKLLNTHTANITSKWWSDNTLGTDETTITFNGGIKTVDNVQNFASIGGNSLAGFYILDQFLPTKSNTRTEYIPLLALPNEQKANGTFDKTRNQTTQTVGDVLKTGNFLRTSKTKEGYDVKVENTTDLTIPGRVAGTSTKIATEIHAGSTDHTFDQQVIDIVVDGVAKRDWNGLHERFDDDHTKGRKDSTLKVTTVTDLIGVSGTKIGSKTSIVEENVPLNSTRTKNKGERGRGVDTSTRKVENFLNSTTFTNNFGGSSENGHSHSFATTINGTANNHTIHDYFLVGANPILTKFYNDIKKTSTTLGTTMTRSPNGVWSVSEYSNTKKFELSIEGTPAMMGWHGSLIDYYTSQTRISDNVDPDFRVLATETTGYLTPVAISNWPVVTLLEDAWVREQWEAIGNTWAGNASTWIWNNGDLLRTVIGAVEVIGGAVLMLGPWAPVTGVINGVRGLALIFYGADQAVSNGMTMRYGRVGKNLSIIETGVYAVTGNETVSVLLPGAAALGISLLPRLAPGLFRVAKGVTDYSSGIAEVGERLYGVGGAVYDMERFGGMLGRYLARRNVILVLNADAELDLGVRGAFTQAGAPKGWARLLLKTDVTREVVWHELGHFIQWRQIGPEAYLGLSRKFGNNVPEQFVFELLQRTGRWDRLSPSYRILQDRNIRIRYGGMGR